MLGALGRRETSSNKTVRKKNSLKWMGIIERKTIHIFNIWRLGSVIELRTDGLREPVDAGRHRFRESRRRRSRSVTARRGQLEFING